MLHIYNSLSKTKERFVPINDPFVGLYVCGPTVYGNAHLGHARPYITFDILNRYLNHLGYKVRYIRNITDVGHLENDSDNGDDKMIKRSLLEKLEPMEVAQKYTNSFHDDMDKLGIIRPSIEPIASGHIPEQIELIQRIIEAGYAYESNGSVYFDIVKYNGDNNCGVLSGRILNELEASDRLLDGQEEKRNKSDFALWKSAKPEHIMRWNSPWSIGFPGWHIECSAMSAKYLGNKFDIHGGGMDLQFPHHECEIAQSVIGNKTEPAKYWMHNNMITLNGKKMGKSLGNAISLNQFFTGEHPLLEQAYSPMTIRFFILQSHYRSTLDFTNDALKGAEKGLKRLLQSQKTLSKIIPSGIDSLDITNWKSECYEVMDDDLNTAMLISKLFEMVTHINNINTGLETISINSLKVLKNLFDVFIIDILGLTNDDSSDNKKEEQLINIIMQQRLDARNRKDWQTSDYIRDELKEIGITLNDNKDGTSYC